MVLGAREQEKGADEYSSYSFHREVVRGTDGSGAAEAQIQMGRQTRKEAEARLREGQACT